MAVLIIAVVPLAFGFLLILFIARYSPNVPRLPDHAARAGDDDRPEITADEFADVVQELLTALGFETVFSSIGTGGVVDITARDPKPLSGGRLLVHASPVLAHGLVDAAEVLNFAEGVRGDMGALKGIFIALAGFTPEARSAVRSTPAPVDLIDGPGLLELVREHVDATRDAAGADRAAELEGYRGFAGATRKHPREAPVDEHEGNTEL
jgi:hypothetical protein